MIILASLLVGFLLGWVQKGITVNINHKNTEIPVKYNDSLVQELPQEVQQYYQQTNGFNQF